MSCILLYTLRWLPIYFTICDLPKLHWNWETQDWEFFYKVSLKRGSRLSVLKRTLNLTCLIYSFTQKIYATTLIWILCMFWRTHVLNRWDTCVLKSTFSQECALLHSITIFSKILLNVTLKKVWKLSFRSGILIINFE